MAKLTVPTYLIGIMLVGEVLMFAGGFVLGRTLSKDSDPPSPSTLHSESNEAELRLRIGSLLDDVDSLKKMNADLSMRLNEATASKSNDSADLGVIATELASTKQELEANKTRLAELSEDVNAIRADVKVKDETIAKLTNDLAEVSKIAFPSKASLVYGEWAKLEEIRTANWGDAGEAASKMTATTLKALFDHINSGKGWDSLPADVLKDVGDQNLKLVELAGKFNKKTPTHADNINGSFAHPILQFNLLSAALESAGVPLSVIQVERLSKIGEEYDAAYAKAQEGYSSSTFHIKKLVDEIELKLDASNAMEAVLTHAQRVPAFPDGMRHLSSFDIYSPAIMLQSHAAPIVGDSRAQLLTNLTTQVARSLGYEVEELANHSQLFEQYLTDCSRLLSPMSMMQAQISHTAMDVVLAGKSQLKLMEALVTVTRPNPEQMEVIQKASRILIPRIAKTE